MSQETAMSQETDVLNPARLAALRRVELLTHARRRSQHIHAAVAVARHGAGSPRALKARALLDAHERAAAGVGASRQELERVILEPEGGSTPPSRGRGSAKP